MILIYISTATFNCHYWLSRRKLDFMKSKEIDDWTKNFVTALSSRRSHKQKRAVRHAAWIMQSTSSSFHRRDITDAGESDVQSCILRFECKRAQEKD